MFQITARTVFQDNIHVFLIGEMGQEFDNIRMFSLMMDGYLRIQSIEHGRGTWSRDGMTLMRRIEGMVMIIFLIELLSIDLTEAMHRKKEWIPTICLPFYKPPEYRRFCNELHRQSQSHLCPVDVKFHSARSRRCSREWSFISLRTWSILPNPIVCEDFSSVCKREGKKRVDEQDAWAYVREISCSFAFYDWKREREKKVQLKFRCFCCCSSSSLFQNEISKNISASFAPTIGIQWPNLSTSIYLPKKIKCFSFSLRPFCTSTRISFRMTPRFDVSILFSSAKSINPIVKGPCWVQIEYDREGN